MKTILYKLTFLTWWHCGSGQAAGPDVDELTMKDADGLPFIPGRTMKGLLRDACRLLEDYSFEGMNMERINAVFGYYNEKKDNEYPKKGLAFFSDMVLPVNDRNKITADKDLIRSLYSSIAATAIGEDGIAKDHSLRKIQVTVPCELYGMIANVSEEDIRMLENAMKYIKRMGLGRSHGLGRCIIQLIEIKES